MSTNPPGQGKTYGKQALRAALQLSEAQFAFVQACGRIPAPAFYSRGEPRWSQEGLEKAFITQQGPYTPTMHNLDRGLDRIEAFLQALKRAADAERGRA